jgi:hypothetical protein
MPYGWQERGAPYSACDDDPRVTPLSGIAGSSGSGTTSGCSKWASCRTPVGKPRRRPGAARVPINSDGGTRQFNPGRPECRLFNPEAARANDHKLRLGRLPGAEFGRER